MTNPKNRTWIKGEKTHNQLQTQSITNTQTTKNMNRKRRWKKKTTTRRTQWNKTEQNKKLTQIRVENHTSSNTHNDPTPTREPPSPIAWPALTNQVAARSLPRRIRGKKPSCVFWVFCKRGKRRKRPPMPPHHALLIKGKTTLTLLQSTVHCEGSYSESVTPFICFVIMWYNLRFIVIINLKIFDCLIHIIILHESY